MRHIAEGHFRADEDPTPRIVYALVLNLDDFVTAPAYESVFLYAVDENDEEVALGAHDKGDVLWTRIRPEMKRDR